MYKKRRDVVKAFVIANENSIFCGKIWFTEAFNQIKRKYKGSAKIKWLKKDGETIKKGQKICQIIASREIVLTAERTALNFIQMLSGISTKTNKYVRKLNNKKIKILDTRKTIPGLRFCQKYAVKKSVEVTIIDQDYMIRFFLKRIIFRASSLFLTLSCLHKKNKFKKSFNRS